MVTRHGRGTSRTRRAALTGALIAALAAALWLAGTSRPSEAASPAPTSVIVLIGDGMGPGQRAATQLARYGLDVTQPMDALPVSGTMFTQSTSAITDSAAGATAIATGVKTKNGYTGVGSSDGRATADAARDRPRRGQVDRPGRGQRRHQRDHGLVRRARQGPRPATPDRQQLSLRHEAGRDPRRRRAVLVPARYPGRDPERPPRRSQPREEEPRRRGPGPRLSVRLRRRGRRGADRAEGARPRPGGPVRPRAARRRTTATTIPTTCPRRRSSRRRSSS